MEQQQDRRRFPSQSPGFQRGNGGPSTPHHTLNSPLDLSYHQLPPGLGQEGYFTPGAGYGSGGSGSTVPPSPRCALPPPGFSSQQSCSNMFRFPPMNSPPPATADTIYHNYHPFGLPPSQQQPMQLDSKNPFSSVHSNIGLGFNNTFLANGRNVEEVSQFNKELYYAHHHHHQQQQQGGYPDFHYAGSRVMDAGSNNENDNDAASAYNGRMNVGSDKGESSKAGIKPILENIVGSMTMSNGTYTHFGPGPAKSPIVFSSDVPQTFSRSDSRDDVSLFDSIGASMSSVGSGSGKESPLGAIGSNNCPARSSTPSDVGGENSSRPQTPGVKPSYSEILAKTVQQNGTPVCSSSSNSASVRKLTSSLSLGAKLEGSSHPGGQSLSSHRKSVDYMNASSSNSSAPSSSCTSSSSSPIAKQKTISQSIVGRLFGHGKKGKENSSNDSAAAKLPPQATLKAQLAQRRSVEYGEELSGGSKRNNYNNNNNDRKVLTASQSNASQSGGSSSNAQLKSSAKPASKNFNDLNGFDFEIQDTDNGTEDDWTTYNYSRGKSAVNKAANNPSNMKRLSTGSCGTSNSSLAEREQRSENHNCEVEPDLLRRESGSEKRPMSSSYSTGASNSMTSSAGSTRKGREKEKPRTTRKVGRNCRLRRVEKVMYLWIAHLISAVAWLFKLVTDVATLSISVGSTVVEDSYAWWVTKARPLCGHQFDSFKDSVSCFFRKCKQAVKWKLPFRRKTDEPNPTDTEWKKHGEDLLAALGPERNISLPSNGDDALKRLLSVKGQDPYCILGIRSDSSDETIRRYYKKQAVLVHPDKNMVLGAEEAFKVLGTAFELVGEPVKRAEYHQKLLEAHAKEKVYGEIGKLLEQLRKKMEIASSSIRCTKCNSRHKKNKTDRPLFAARFCAQCGIHHGAREGELWAERKRWFGYAWNYFACMDSYVWEINEWAKCQKKNLLHIKADSHCVMYRLVAGSGNQQQAQPPNGVSSPQPGSVPDGNFQADAEDDWDSLINNLCKSTGGVPSGGKAGNGSNGSGTVPPSSSSNVGGRKRKGKRK